MCILDLCWHYESNHPSGFNYCSSFCFPFTSQRRFFFAFHEAECPVFGWFWTLHFCVEWSWRSFSPFSVHQSGQYKYVYCQLELALTLKSIMKSIFFPFSQVYLYDADLRTRQRELPQKSIGQKKLYSPPSSLLGAFPCKYHPLVLVCKHYRNQPENKTKQSLILPIFTYSGLNSRQ